MYRNLEAEIARKGIHKKDIADVWGCRVATVYDKLNGKYPIKLDEAMALKKEFFPEMEIEYLFKKYEVKGA